MSAINAKGKVIPPRKQYGSFLSQCTLKHSSKQIPNTKNNGINRRRKFLLTFTIGDNNTSSVREIYQAVTLKKKLNRNTFEQIYSFITEVLLNWLEICNYEFCSKCTRQNSSELKNRVSV